MGSDTSDCHECNLTWQIGHYERKLKHLNKQKEGKKRLKRLAGNIDVPQAAFFEVLSSRRAFSTTAAPRTSLLDPVSANLPEDIPFPSQPTDRASAVHEPLRLHSISPQLRSSRLSAIHRLIESPKSDITAEDIYAAYAKLGPASAPESHSFTPAELSEVIHSLHTLDRREGAGRKTADARLSRIMLELRSLRKGSSRRGVEVAAFVSRARHRRRVTSGAIGAAERSLSALFPNPSALETERERRYYRQTVNHMLYLCGLAAETRRFGPWWDSMQGAGIEPDSYAFLAKQVLLEKSGRIDDIPQLLNSALQRVDSYEGQIALINHVIYIHAIAGKWDVVVSAYSKLCGSHDDEPLPPPFNIEPRDLLGIPEGLIPSRLTFACLIHACSYNGHLPAALTIMRHMFEFDHTPSIPEYLSLFKGFARHGQIPKTPRRARPLFPFWETYDPAQGKEDRVSWIWCRGALGLEEPEVSSPWTKEALDELFRSFIALTPTTGVGPSFKRAPSPRQVWSVLLAFARTTNGEDQVVREVWDVMDGKFVGEGWVGWRTDSRLEKLREGLERIGSSGRGFEAELD